MTMGVHNPLHAQESPAGSDTSIDPTGSGSPNKRLRGRKTVSGQSVTGSGSVSTRMIDHFLLEAGCGFNDRDPPSSRNEDHLIEEWPATALCGNDVMSSCLYTIGLVTRNSGKVAPIAFILVSLVLHLIRSVYAMAILYFPNNGGSYNLLANVAPKPVAALGACLSVMSYVATCVVSAVSACEYLGRVFDFNPVLSSVVLLCVFAGLVLTGLKESTSIAFAIFLVHMATLWFLCMGCLLQAASTGFSVFWLNMEEPSPTISILGKNVASSLGIAIYMGFSSAMLGVSGYETSAQIVESMMPGVFVKTLRNLWIGVTIVNPLLSLLAITVLPLNDIAANSDTVLAKMAMVWGDWMFGQGSGMSQLMADWMSIEAFIVLSGAVLTAFVGVDGLIFQMASDRCLPIIFLQKNHWRGTNHYIILTFLVLCITQILIMKGEVSQLAGIYSISFLSVLATFTIGGMLLKASPKHAPALISRGLMLPWWHLALTLGLLLLSLAGQLLGSKSVIISFFSYFIPIFILCLVCLYMDRLNPMCTNRVVALGGKPRSLSASSDGSIDGSRTVGGGASPSDMEGKNID